MIIFAIKLLVMNRRIILYSLLLLYVFINSCGKDGGINFFSLQDDVNLGRQLEQEIASNPAQFPILPEQQFPQAYSFIRAIRDSVLNSGQVRHKDDFVWSVKIIRDDNTLNAFAAPGGFIYVYTGLIKFLDTEAELAGVMGHEIAHADRRHSTDQLTQQFGFSLLAGLIAGTTGQDQLAQMAAGLTTLAFSRKAESEADEFSVKYLCPTSYNAAGAAGFFEKIEALGGQSPPQFLSTHPNPDNRIENIISNKTKSGCTGSGTFDQRYQQFKASLP